MQKSGVAPHGKKDLFQKKKIMWWYNLSNGLSPVLFLNISYTSYQWITVKLILFFQNNKENLH